MWTYKSTKIDQLLKFIEDNCDDQGDENIIDDLIDDADSINLSDYDGYDDRFDKGFDFAMYILGRPKYNLCKTKITNVDLYFAGTEDKVIERITPYVEMVKTK